MLVEKLVTKIVCLCKTAHPHVLNLFLPTFIFCFVIYIFFFPSVS